MKRGIHLVLDEQELRELMRILEETDAEGALAFIHRHMKEKARLALEGG